MPFSGVKIVTFAETKADVFHTDGIRRALQAQGFRSRLRCSGSILSRFPGGVHDSEVWLLLWRHTFGVAVRERPILVWVI